MSKILVFDLRGPIAHFRRPDTLATHATYPFLPRTALRGLLGSVLGLNELAPGSLAGLRLMAPVRTVAQELTLHGKTWEAKSGRAESFHRPTSIELVVGPHYRVFYRGPYADELEMRLRAGQSHYHTYLGSAFCLTVPEWVGAFDADQPSTIRASSPITCATVVPAKAVARLIAAEGSQYARVGGLLREHLGPFSDRRFRGTLAVLYEVNGRTMTFEPVEGAPDIFWQFYEVPGEGTVCLW
jgi:CRISPR-associated protein Cas5h